MYRFNSKNCLVNLASSILKHFDVEPFYETIPEVDNLLRGQDKVVMLLFDGMGKSIINEHLDKESFIRNHIIKEIDSVFPPTTVAATDALLSGKFPIENGWLGWACYFKHIDEIVNVFPNTDNYTDQPAKEPNLMNRFAGYDNLMELIQKKNSDIFVDSVWPSFGHNPCVNMDEYFKKLDEMIDTEEKSFIYGYWDEPDHLMHINGTHSAFVDKTMKDIDARLEELCKKHKDTTFLVIADHSQINVKYIDITEHQDFFDTLIRPYAIESRAATFFVKEEQKEMFETLFEKYYGNDFELFTREQVLKQEIFGTGQPHPFSLEALGDYLAVSIDEYTFINDFSRFTPDDLLIGHHAGGTAEEAELYLMGIRYNR